MTAGDGSAMASARSDAGCGEADSSARSAGRRAATVLSLLLGLVVAPAVVVGGNSSASEGSGVEIIDHSGGSESGERAERDSEGGADDDESGEGDRVETIEHAGESGGDGDSEAEGSESDGESGEAGSSGAGTARFTGHYGSGVWVDAAWQGDREDVFEWRGELGLELEQDLSVNWSAVAGAELRYWYGAQRGFDVPRAAAEPRLEETYVLFRADRWAFRAGHLRTAWGSTSLVRPGDVVNPVDATAFADPSDASGRLLPQPAAELSYVRPDWSLTGVVVPFFVPNRVTLFGRDSAVAAGRNRAIGRELPVTDLARRLLDRSIFEEAQPLLASPSRPDERPENASVGLRWTATAWNTDFGVGYFWGWDRTPSIDIDGELRDLGRLAAEDGRVLRDFDLQGFLERNPEALDLLDSISERRRAGEQLVDIGHDRLHSLVVDASRHVGPVGVRADVTLQPERTYVTRGLGTVRRPTVFGAIGVSYERFVADRPFVATVEGFWLEPFDADAAPTRLFVDEEDRGGESTEILLFGEHYRGAAAAVDWRLPVADLGVRLGSLVELDGGGIVADAELARRWAPWLRTSVAARVYGGPDPEEELTLGGLYERNDRIGLRFEGSF